MALTRAWMDVVQPVPNHKKSTRQTSQILRHHQRPGDTPAMAPVGTWHQRSRLQWQQGAKMATTTWRSSYGDCPCLRTSNSPPLLHDWPWHKIQGRRKQNQRSCCQVKISFWLTTSFFKVVTLWPGTPQHQKRQQNANNWELTGLSPTPQPPPLTLPSKAKSCPCCCTFSLLSVVVMGEYLSGRNR